MSDVKESARHAATAYFKLHQLHLAGNSSDTIYSNNFDGVCLKFSQNFNCLMFWTPL